MFTHSLYDIVIWTTVTCLTECHVLMKVVMNVYEEREHCLLLIVF